MEQGVKSLLLLIVINYLYYTKPQTYCGFFVFIKLTIKELNNICLTQVDTLIHVSMVNSR